MGESLAKSSVHTGQKASHTRKYVVICVVLVVLTFIEYIVFKIDDIRDNAVIMYPSLGVLSLIKLVLVVGSYMHLNHESKLLKLLFVGGVFMTLLIFMILTLADPLAH